MSTMKQYMEEIHETRLNAEESGKMWEKYFAYTWSIIELNDNTYKLILQNGTVMMG